MSGRVRSVLRGTTTTAQHTQLRQACPHPCGALSSKCKVPDGCAFSSSKGQNGRSLLPLCQAGTGFVLLQRSRPPPRISHHAWLTRPILSSSMNAAALARTKSIASATDQTPAATPSDPQRHRARSVPVCVTLDPMLPGLCFVCPCNRVLCATEGWRRARPEPGLAHQATARCPTM